MTTPAPDSSPVRVVLSRRKGWRMPPNTIRVCHPTKWGNPFCVADILDAYDGDAAAAQADCVRSYRQWLEDSRPHGGAELMDDIRQELRGKNLACWCKAGTPCHADVLLEFANQPKEPHPPKRKRLKGSEQRLQPGSQ